MPAAVTKPAVRALSPEERGRIPLKIQPLIPTIPSALTVKRENVNTTATTSVPQDMWISVGAAHVTVAEPPVRHLPTYRRVRKVKLCIDK